MKGGKGNVKPDPKNQKTIVDFFKRQSAAPTPITKVSCPGCDLKIPESKINWHLDQDCKSKTKHKRKKDANLAKRKKILKSVKTEIENKKKKRVMLSDDESDSALYSDNDDVVVLSSQESSDGDPPYIPSSMVETRIFELDDEGPSASTHNPSTNGKAISPEGENKRVLECRSVTSAERRIAVLKSDWTSPYLQTPTKTPDVRSETVEEISSAQVISAGQDVRKMLESDWTDQSPMSSPKATNSVAAKADEDMEDFEPSPVRYATPRKYSVHSPKSSPSSSKKSTDVNKNLHNYQKKSLSEDMPSQNSQKNSRPELSSPATSSSRTKEDSDDDFEEPMQFRTPELHRKKKGLHSGEKRKSKDNNSFSKACDLSSSSVANESIEFYTPLKSPVIVTPTRSPSPESPVVDHANDICASPLEKTTNDIKKKLFTPPSTPTKCKQTSDWESIPSTSKAPLPLDENSQSSRSQDFENDDPFDALLISASQKAEESENLSSSQKSSYRFSPSQKTQSSSTKIGMIRVRTPRKINQSIKSTGLLQSSPQNVKRSFIAKRSPSATPEKAGRTHDSLPSSQGSQMSPDGKYDKAMFRNHKGYYLENFLLILESVMSEPSNLVLFNDDDMSVVNSFHGLSLPAQKLYVRLFQRKVKWNKVCKIEYRDICDQEDTELYVNELSYANYLLLESDLMELKEVLQLLSAEDLKKLCKSMKVSASGKKEDMINSIQKLSKEQNSVMSVFSKGPHKKASAVMKQAKEILGRCCIVNKEVRRVFIRIIMLYGLPRHDDDDDSNNHTQLTTLLMVNLGKMVFPKYQVIKEHAIFRSRDDLIRFESCSQILTDVSDCLESQKWEEALDFCKLAKATYEELLSDGELMAHDMSLPRFLRCFSPISILVHVLSCSVECYQRLKNYRKAVEQLRFLLKQKAYLQDYRGRWSDRLALNLEMHLKSPTEALDVIKSSLSDPEIRKGHRLSLSIRAERMAAALRYKNLAPAILELPLMKPREAPRVIIEGRCLPGDAGYKRVFISQDSDRHAGEGQVTVCSVEELVLGYYKKEGYSEGLHREGSTVNSLFGLFFWDIIYSPIPDVFQSRHQAAPLDLDDLHFYDARKAMIEERLSQLQGFTEEEAGNEIDRIWNENFGKTAMIAWDIFRNVDYVKGLVASLTLPVLAAICRRLAKDHRFTRSGFPDLMVWNPVQKKCCIVEVKGPNDRLSTKQILWLDYLLENHAKAEVCHVEAIGAKKMKLASPRRISPKKRTPVKSKVSPKKRTPTKAKSNDNDSDWKPETKTKRGTRKDTRIGNTIGENEDKSNHQEPETRAKRGTAKRTRRENTEDEDKEMKPPKMRRVKGKGIQENDVLPQVKSESEEEPGLGGVKKNKETKGTVKKKESKPSKSEETKPRRSNRRVTKDDEVTSKPSNDEDDFETSTLKKTTKKL